MSLVYRIQSKQDRTQGCYDVCRVLNVRPDVVQAMHDAHGSNADSKHPNPYQEFERGSKHNEYCGFNRAADLLRWFKGFIPDLLRAGYEIVALDDVTITAVGEFQVLFTFNN